MLYTEIIAVCSEIHTRHINTVCGQNVESVLLQARSAQRVPWKLRFPDYVTMAQDGGRDVSLTHRPLFTPRKYSWYSFLLEAESTPGP